MADWIINLLIIVVAFIVGLRWVAIHRYFFWLKCPACKQFNALLSIPGNLRTPVDFQCGYWTSIGANIADISNGSRGQWREDRTWA